jgi:PAS domain S-box-containing protein
MDTSISFKHIFNSTSNGVIATDAQERIGLINSQAEEILGLRKDRVCGTPISAVLPKTGVFVKKCPATGEPQLGRHVLGKEIQFVVNITPIQETGGLLEFMKVLPRKGRGG